MLGRVGPEQTDAPGQPLTKPGRSLPRVISWLDPDMKSPAPRPDRSGHDAPFPVLRPPGAIRESEFLAACTRCGDCLRACQPGAIRLAPEPLRGAAGTPVIDPLVAPCLLCEELPCIRACEPGALRPEAPAQLGTALVQLHDCLNRLGSECSVCSERCPVPGAIQILAGVPSVDASLCTGCGMCQHACPAPRNAVMILPNPDRPTSASLSRLAQEDAARAATPDAHTPNPPPLPELQDEVVDDDTVRALFGDLAALTEVVEIKLKGGAASYADTSRIDLAAAETRLLAHQTHAVQIVYRYGADTWCDTLIRTSAGTRVLRIQSPTRASGLV